MFTVRPANLSQDGPWLLEAILALAFESEGIHLIPEVVERGIAHVFDHPEKGTYYVVTDASNAPIGMTLVTCEWSDWNNTDYWWLQSVYIETTHRGQGALAALVHYIQDLAKSQQVSELRLYVETQNLRAQRAYQKLGFQGNHYQVMQCQV